MADRKIVYTLDFKANTEDVKTQLDQVGHSLQAIASRKLIDGHQFDEAANAALRMKGHLDKALDPSTGKLDLTRLSVSMKNAGDSAQSLALKFKSIGAEGNRAFLQVANAVANAQPSMIRTGKLLDGLWTSLKNTARWQISSAVLSGFTGALSSAVSFAKDLNKSLNDIRIVSGESADEMKRFAKEANNMAKAIGTSTNDITRGTLIYKQQGDDMELAAKKAEITAKAAAITTESTAAEMSEYLTGIWNSYEVGSENLELFVDKLAYAGATTATSMEEIATSMTKVASTASSLGVEYDQLLGIISTVSSRTRVSAEQVGTAYKTIFARMADLQLEGSIDEDGITTTLGDVSSTLKQVGVDVLDAQGNLRDMGDVIEELGGNWNNFSRDQQAAIANVVAGKRQYTQLFALFDGWEEYEKTVNGVADAQGELNKQHGVYLESWQAASERIKANMEDIIADTYSDEGILSMMNGFAGILELLDKIIEGAGGFGPILLTLGSIATRVFRTQIGAGLENIWTNLLILTGQSKRVTNEMQAQFSATAKTLATEMSGGYAQVEAAQADYLVSLFEFQNKYSQSYSKMRDETRQLIELEKQRKMQGFAEATENISAGQSGLSKLSGKKVDFSNAFSTKTNQNAIKFLAEEYKKAGISFDAAKVDLQEFGQVASQSSKPLENFQNIIDGLHKKIALGDEERENFLADIQKIRDGSGQIEEITGEFDEFGEKMSSLEDSTMKNTETISQLSSGVLALGSAFMSTSSMWDTFLDDSATAGDIATSLLTTLPMVAFSVIQIANAMKVLNVAMSGGWMAAVGIAIVAITGIVKGFQKASVSAEEAAQKYEDVKNQVEEVNSLLEEKKEKLEEIEKLKPTEQNTAEQEQLSAEIALLEEKKKILEDMEKKTNKEKSKKAAAEADDLISEYGYRVRGGMDFSSGSNYYRGARDLTDLTDEDSYINKLYGKLELIDPELDKEAYEKVKAEIDRLLEIREEFNLYQEAEETAKLQGRGNDKEYIRQLVEGAKAVKIITEEKEKQAEAEAEWADTVNSSIKALKNYDKSFDTVNDAIEEFKDKGKLSYDTIVALKEEFGTGDGLDKLYEGLANGTIGLAEFKDRMADVIETTIMEDIVTGKLNGANKEMIQSYLESKGVTNAAAKAQKIYNLALAQSEVKNAKVGSELEDIAKKYNLTKEEIFRLKVMEDVLNNNNLNMSQKINELKKYIQWARAAGIAIGGLGDIESGLVGKSGSQYLSDKYIQSQGYTKVSTGKKKGAQDNTYKNNKTGQTMTHDEVQNEIISSKMFGDSSLDLGFTGGDFTGPAKDKPSAKEIAEREREYTETIMDIQQEIADAKAEYAETVADISEELAEKEKQFAEDMAEAWKEEYLEQLKDTIAKAEEVINRHKEEIEISDFGLDLLDEKDFGGRSDLLTTKLSQVTAYGEEMRKEFERVASIVPKNADEAQELANRLTELGDDMRDNVSTLRETKVAIQQLRIDAFTSVLEDDFGRLEQELDNIDKRIEILNADSKDDYKYTKKFLNMQSLLPVASDLDKVLSEKRKHDRDMISQEKKTQNTINDIVKKALDMQMKENAEAREKERKKLVEDMEKARQDAAEKMAEAQRDLQNTIKEAGEKLHEATEDYKEWLEENELATDDAVVHAKKVINNANLTFPKPDISQVKQAIEDIVEEVKKIDNVEIDLDVKVKEGNDGKGGGADGGSGGSSVVDAAISQLGVPYVYGGITPGKGLDCSGLTQYAYRQAGKEIPRTSQEQFKGGTPVNKEDLKPGDLVFFIGSGGSKNNPGHVGIYVGNDQFIHAPSTGQKVSYATLSTKGGYVGARRYAKGTPFHPGGLAMVGDENWLKGWKTPSPELAIYPDGTSEVVGKDGVEIRNLPKGTQVIPAKQTKEILNKNGIPNYADGTEVTLETYKELVFSLAMDPSLVYDVVKEIMGLPDELFDVSHIREHPDFNKVSYDVQNLLIRNAIQDEKSLLISGALAEATNAITHNLDLSNEERQERLDKIIQLSDGIKKELQHQGTEQFEKYGYGYLSTVEVGNPKLHSTQTAIETEERRARFNILVDKNPWIRDLKRAYDNYGVAADTLNSENKYLNNDELLRDISEIITGYDYKEKAVEDFGENWWELDSVFSQWIPHVKPGSPTWEAMKKAYEEGLNWGEIPIVNDNDTGDQIIVINSKLKAAGIRPEDIVTYDFTGIPKELRQELLDKYGPGTFGGVSREALFGVLDAQYDITRTKERALTSGLPYEKELAALVDFAHHTGVPNLTSADKSIYYSLMQYLDPIREDLAPFWHALSSISMDATPESAESFIQRAYDTFAVVEQTRSEVGDKISDLNYNTFKLKSKFRPLYEENMGKYNAAFNGIYKSEVTGELGFLSKTYAEQLTADTRSDQYVVDNSQTIIADLKTPEGGKTILGKLKRNGYEIQGVDENAQWIPGYEGFFGTKESGQWITKDGTIYVMGVLGTETYSVDNPSEVVHMPTSVAKEILPQEYLSYMEENVFSKYAPSQDFEGLASLLGEGYDASKYASEESSSSNDKDKPDIDPKLQEIENIKTGFSKTISEMTKDIMLEQKSIEERNLSEEGEVKAYYDLTKNINDKYLDSLDKFLQDAWTGFKDYIAYVEAYPDEYNEDVYQGWMDLIKRIGETITDQESDQVQRREDIVGYFDNYYNKKLNDNSTDIATILYNNPNANVNNYYESNKKLKSDHIAFLQQFRDSEGYYIYGEEIDNLRASIRGDDDAINNYYSNYHKNILSNIAHDRNMALNQDKKADVTEFYNKEQAEYHIEAERLRKLNPEKYRKEIQELEEKWWAAEAAKIQAVGNRFNEYKTVYDAIADELIRREEEAMEKLDKQIEKLEHRNTLEQSYNSILNNLRATQHEIDKELRNSMLSQQYLSETEKEKIFNAEDYLVITEEIADIEEEIQKSYAKYQNDINKLKDDELYKAEKLTKEFEAQTAEKERALEILRLEIDLTKKRQALTDALQEKNVRVYQGGRWVQMANFRDVQSAAEALAETEYQISEKKILNQQELDKTETELKIAQLQEKKSAHQAEIDEINEMTETLNRAKKEWDLGFSATGKSANDLATAFNDAMNVLSKTMGSWEDYYEEDEEDRRTSSGSGGGYFSSSKEREELKAIYDAKVLYDKDISEFHKQDAKHIANKIRENSSYESVKGTVNMSAAEMEEKYGFASGTNDTPSGIAQVNEKGLELYATSSGQFIELNPHGKIFNNDQFNYLYYLSRGKTSIDAYKNSGALTIGQMTLALPNVTDTQSFAEGLKHLNEYIRNTKKF